MEGERGERRESQNMGSSSGVWTAERREWAIKYVPSYWVLYSALSARRYRTDESDLHASSYSMNVQRSSLNTKPSSRRFFRMLDGTSKTRKSS